MPIKVTRLQDLPAILLEHEPPLKVPDDPQKNMEETLALKRERGGHIYRIIDIRNVDLKFSDMMMSMDAERNKEGGSGDPDVTTCFVGSGALVEMGTKALAEQDQYGKGRVVLFTSQEDAIDYVRKQVNQ